MRLRIVILAVVSAALVDAPVAATSCASAVIVDGRILFGHGDVAAADLPRRAGERDAVEPACNDEESDDPDHTVSVMALEGIPSGVAVVRLGHPAGLYVAEGSLVVSSAHPLHRAIHRGTARRRRGCRPASGVVRGSLAADSSRTVPTMAVRSGPQTFVVHADARTRLTNRPPYEPLNPGQPVEIRTSICGSRRVADTIAFDGATVPVDPVETDAGGSIDLDPRWVAALAFAAVIAALLLAARRLGRADR